MNAPITYIESRMVPLPIENVDTDQIIPARFLKAVDKKGFGDNLFYDWRYEKSGAPKSDFILNNPVYQGEILLAGKNFGCGSSREHAAWAIRQFGFSAVISSYFADIFKANALNNGLLAIEVSDDFLDTLFQAVETDPLASITVNLPEQRVYTPNKSTSFHFDINPYKKQCLLTGQDDLDYLLGLADEIKEFEKNQVIY